MTAFAQVDLYPFPNIEDPKVKKPKEKKKPEPFALALSKKMEIAVETVTENFAKGLGRTELIRLILISKKSGQPLAELVKEREKGTRLAKISAAAGQNSKENRKEALTILKSVEEEESKIKLALAASTSTTAGTDRNLTENREEKSGEKQ